MPPTINIYDYIQGMIKDTDTRKRNRMKNCDYSDRGYYFVTLCLKERIPLFGSIEKGTMVLNDRGLIVNRTWIEIPEHYPNVGIEAFVVMPDHIHGIIVIRYLVGRCDSTDLLERSERKSNYGLLSKIVKAFKEHSSKRIYRETEDTIVWQRSFYDRVIRSKAELRALRRYINGNPKTMSSIADQGVDFFLES